MRAGPLSNDKVIGLLNGYFVPVFLSTEEYGKGGEAAAEEKALFKRIANEAWRGKAVLLPPDSCYYLLAPDGRILDCSGYSNASTAEPVIELLESTIKELRTQPGKPLVRPRPLSVPPKADPDSLILHLTARYLPSGGVWGKVPAENWVVLKSADWQKLLPPADAQEGASWEIDKDVARRLLLYFYPPSPNNNLAKNRIEEQALTATLVSVTDGVARAKVEGRLKMKHFFLPLADDHTVDAKIVGFVDFDLAKKRIRSVRIVTDHATYAKGGFGVAVRSVP